LAICLSGELDPDQTIALIDQYFGDWAPDDFPPFTYEEQPPIEQPLRAEVVGQESPFVELGWRIGGGTSDDFMLANLAQHLLHNEQAGLLDRYLNHEQKLLESEAYTWTYEDYAVFGLLGKPREGQSLEEVEQLLLGEAERLGHGDFPDWLLEAALNDMKLGDLRALESNSTRVGALASCFILGLPWSIFVHRYEQLEKITKADVTNWARTNLRPDNFAIIYKKEGTDDSVVKVNKPAMTPVPLQREAISDYARNFLQTEPPRLAPIYADFANGIHRETWQPGLDFHYVHNPYNPTFRLDYIFEMGKSNSLDLALAMILVDYLGTDRFPAADIKDEFFRLGLSMDAYHYNQRCHISLQGLEESLEAGLKLLEHFLAQVQPDQQIWENVVADLLIKRRNQKQDRGTILREAMSSFANYGPDAPFNSRPSAAELQKLDPAVLTDFIHQMHQYQHRIYYFGQQPASEVATLLKKHHRRADQLQTPPPPKPFLQLPTERSQVLFTHFPMVQAEVLMISRGTPHFNLEEYIIHDLFNEYFGYGLSSIVFQEIREAKALAYNTYAYYSSPHRADQAHYLRAYVGTQPDKLTEALPAMLDLMNHMPVVEEAINQARMSMLQRIETDRIPPRKLYWEAQTAND
ncbi:MAG: insulinase family protein, partial [Lewinella sp.]|nr:insulinase family protein [Lewinella sp.]